MPAVGEVHLLWCGTCVPPKEKFFVVAMTSPLRCFLINSAPRAVEMRTSRSLTMAVPVDAARHRFLKYDSYVSCSTLFAEHADPAEFTAATYLGSLHPDVKVAVRASFSTNDELATGRLKSLDGEWQ